MTFNHKDKEMNKLIIFIKIFTSLESANLLSL
jgi:hypothetical protein